MLMRSALIAACLYHIAHAAQIKLACLLFHRTAELTNMIKPKASETQNRAVRARPMLGQSSGGCHTPLVLRNLINADKETGMLVTRLLLSKE